MKKILLISIFVSLILISIISAQPSTQINYTTASSNQGIAITQLKYSPYPASPGEYLDLWIQAEYLGVGYAPNATFVLNPKYPFSLDSGENAMYSFNNLAATPVLLHYKIRVDQNAVQGDNQLELDYSSNGGLNGVWSTQPFDIQVTNAQTDFDLVVQGTGSTGTSIGIANTGENTANSLIVKIPAQSGFAVSGTSGQIVGNLNSGDYTLVVFNVIPSSRNQTKNQLLKVELDYTDTIGVRRAVIKEISFGFPSFSNSTNFMSGSSVRGMTQSSRSIINDAWFWIVSVIVIGGGATIFLIKIKKKRRAKNSSEFSRVEKLKPKENSKEPDWVSAERTKKK